MRTLLIKNVRVLDPSCGRDMLGSILIRDGKIESVEESAEVEGAVLLDGCGLTAAPGLVDMHVHFRDPGQTYKEDLLTGAAAAAAGGVTSVLCMPNTAPAVDSEAGLAYIKEKSEKAKIHIYQAAAITRGLQGKELTDFAELKHAGAAAVSDDGRPVSDDGLMRAALEQAALKGLPVLSHCEDLALAGGVMHEGETSRALGVKGIPAAAEDHATARELSLIQPDGCPLHICHVSTAASFDMIRKAKAEGKRVTCETAPHYFVFTDQKLKGKNANFRMNPPLRTESDREAVIRAIADGTVDAIATDHAPHAPEDKANFVSAPNGVLGLETSLAAGITYLVKPGHITLLRLLELMSTSPARILGISGGTLKPGAPADIILFSMEEKWTVDPEKLHSKARNTPFAGMELTGRVKYTIVGGNVIFNEEAEHHGVHPAD